MRILCRHGHFSFYPKNAEELTRLMGFFGEELIKVQDFYTFPILSDAPDFSILGVPYIGAAATATFEGNVWEIMKANGLVLNLATKLIVPKISIITTISFSETGLYLLPNTLLIQPGSLSLTGQRVLGYDAEFDLVSSNLKVYQVDYE